jgi:hypothetical protein
MFHTHIEPQAKLQSCIFVTKRIRRIHTIANVLYGVTKHADVCQEMRRYQTIIKLLSASFIITTSRDLSPSCKASNHATTKKKKTQRFVRMKSVYFIWILQTM